jgi:hypothetical protein
MVETGARCYICQGTEVGYGEEMHVCLTCGKHFCSLDAGLVSDCCKNCSSKG